MHVHRAERLEEVIENCTVEHSNFLCDFVFIHPEEMQNGPSWKIPNSGKFGQKWGTLKPNLKASEG